MIDPYRFGPWVSKEAQARFRVESALPPAPSADDIAALRQHYDRFNQHHLGDARAHYAVDIARNEIAGVPVDIVTPVDGVADDRTLICLHGGAFMWGRGAGALLEAVPVAATSKMRVIAVEYSLAPEKIFPAAVDDVLAVYTALCRQQGAESIGIYGCSAGAILTTQVVARLIKDGGSPPGAIVMIGGAGLDMQGDSSATVGLLNGEPEGMESLALSSLPYFSSTDPADAMVFPGNCPATLAAFPPSLLVTGTRDFAASSVTVMHRRLVAAGAEAQLLHFDGMWHAHHMATTLPESRETFAAMARFFDTKLA